MKKELICIICPRGCSLTAHVENGTVTVEGNTCPRGEEYAINECLHPMRTVTAVVRVANRENAMVSVKTEAPVPKEKMLEVMALLHETAVQAPVRIGDVLLPSVFGTRVIATRDCE